MQYHGTMCVQSQSDVRLLCKAQDASCVAKFLCKALRLTLWYAPLLGIQRYPSSCKSLLHQTPPQYCLGAEHTCQCHAAQQYCDDCSLVIQHPTKHLWLSIWAHAAFATPFGHRIFKVDCIMHSSFHGHQHLAGLHLCICMTFWHSANLSKSAPQATLSRRQGRRLKHLQIFMLKRLSWSMVL